MTGCNSPGAKPAAIYDVARRAGISHQTVFHARGGHDGIRPETRALAAGALNALNCRANVTARNLLHATCYTAEPG